MPKRRGSVLVKCKTCKEEFGAWPFQLKLGLAKYCSKQCYWESKRTGYTNSSGYTLTCIKTHPLATKAGKVLDHWLVMYKQNPEFTVWAKENKWTVHHKNGVRDDNRLENLEWRAPGRHPTGWTVAQMIETLERLGYTILMEEK